LFLRELHDTKLIKWKCGIIKIFLNFISNYEILYIICGNKIPTRCNRSFFIADLIACSTCFGHHYAHHQEFKSIIQWLLPVVFRAVVFKLLVWCVAEGYVSGLQEAAASSWHFNSTY